MELSDLQADCTRCCGLCCIALYFSKADGFPVDKEAGNPCPNLQSDFSCGVHADLKRLGMKGCMAYDCFGAGQRVTQFTYGGITWKQAPEIAEQMFRVFLVVEQLNEMLWYLRGVADYDVDGNLHHHLQSILQVTDQLTFLDANSLMELDVAAHRASVNALFQQISQTFRMKVRSCIKAPRKHKLAKHPDLSGQDLRGQDLRGEDFRGALLIAADLRGADLSGADLIGADLRDTDLRGANLSNALFLTQAQINTARGDSTTKLPKAISTPVYW